VFNNEEESMKAMSAVSRAVLCAAVPVLVAACGERTPSKQAGAPAPAQPTQVVELNMASAFPTSLTLIGEAAPKFADKVKRASGGTIDIKVYEPGALVPSLETIPAVSKGSVASAWSSPGFFTGTDSAFAFFTTVPFGPGAAEFLGWMYYGGGLQLQTEMFAKHDIHAIPCGITPPEASGWFRKEIKSLDDLKGLKMRFFGLGAKVMDKFGVSTQLLAPGDIFQALQLGTIDATEFANPSLDEKLGFYQVAKYYYFPGWHQPASFLDLFVNQKVWDGLSDQHKAILEESCSDSLLQILAEGEATQWAAMKRMRDEHGVKIMRWSPEILKAYEKAWNEVVADESKANPNFKKVYDSYSTFRANYAIWRDYGYLQ
jgi:TRAP-type mannitol/chloroaromatic compound transport system substrate-binding protein